MIFANSILSWWLGQACKQVYPLLDDLAADIQNMDECVIAVSLLPDPYHGLWPRG